MLKILLIDDDQDSPELLRGVAESASLDIELTPMFDSEQALAYLLKLHNTNPSQLPDLILLDLHMPKKDGHSFLTDISAIPELRSTPVVIMSALIDRHFLAEEYPPLRNQFFEKPMRFKDYVALFSDLYERSRKGELRGLGAGAAA